MQATLKNEDKKPWRTGISERIVGKLLEQFELRQGVLWLRFDDGHVLKVKASQRVPLRLRLTQGDVICEE